MPTTAAAPASGCPSAPLRQVAARLAAAHPIARTELECSSAFELLVATVLSAQTTDQRVNAVTGELFSRWPDASALASADEDDLAALLRPLGMGPTRARRIRSLAAQLLERHGGEVPEDQQALEALSGVGRKTALVVRGVWFGQDALAVDTHVMRLAARLGWTSSRDAQRVEKDVLAQREREMADSAVPYADGADLSLRLILHGRRVCTARAPQCGRCVLADLCPAAQVPDAPQALSVPAFLADLAARADGSATDGMQELLHRDEAALVDTPSVRHSAVLVLITGTSLAQAHVLLHERGHTLRSQPGQFALPGGGVEPQDADAMATALREAREEVGLDPEQVQVLGAFAPVPMPHRGRLVTPVLAWASRQPPVSVVDPVEVERVVWVPLVGEGSLSELGRRGGGLLDGRSVGPLFDLPDDVLVWGLTAFILDAVLAGVGLPGWAQLTPTPQDADAPAPRGGGVLRAPQEIPAHLRR